MQRKLTNLVMASAVLAALCGCGQPEATKGIADEIDKALDRTPQYVDEPADEPTEPR